MRISDWSSDVCSSDLLAALQRQALQAVGRGQQLRAATDLREQLRSLVVGVRSGDQRLRGLDVGFQRIGARLPVEQGQHRGLVGATDGDGIAALHAVEFGASTLEAVLQRSVENTSDLQAQMRRSYAVFCLNK